MADGVEDAASVDWFDTDGTRGRVNVARPGTLSGSLLCELTLAILVTLDVTREMVWEFRRELGPRTSSKGDLVGTSGEGGAVRGAKVVTDFE